MSSTRDSAALVRPRARSLSSSPASQQRTLNHAVPEWQWSSTRGQPATRRQRSESQPPPLPPWAAAAAGEQYPTPCEAADMTKHHRRSSTLTVSSTASTAVPSEAGRDFDVQKAAIPEFEEGKGLSSCGLEPEDFYEKPAPCLLRASDRYDSTPPPPTLVLPEEIEPVSAALTAGDAAADAPAGRYGLVKTDRGSGLQSPNLTVPYSTQFPPQSIFSRTFLRRVSSLDAILRYREEKAEFQRTASPLGSHVSLPCSGVGMPGGPRDDAQSGEATAERNASVTSAATTLTEEKRRLHRFRSRLAVRGFHVSTFITGFLGEYLVTGYAIQVSRADEMSGGGGKVDGFWPAILLTLIQSAFIFMCARLGDRFGGYKLYMGGMLVLLAAGIAASQVKDYAGLCVTRALQGIGLALVTPAVNTMLGRHWRNDPRGRMLCMAMYAAGAPAGFFAGNLVAAALPAKQAGWYSGVSGIAAALAAAITWLVVPAEDMDSESGAQPWSWDMAGSMLFPVAFVLTGYALAAGPYAEHGFRSAGVLAPLVVGVSALILVLYLEERVVACPLLPRGFFRQKGVTPISIAGLCFFASYGIWLYYTAAFFQSPLPDGSKQAVTGWRLALWYTPAAIGGLVLCIGGGWLLRSIRPQYVLCVSALAWEGAPLFLYLCGVPVDYWRFVLPSMLCATFGLDLTYLTMLSYLTELGSVEYPGFAGAFCSILVSLGMSIGPALAQVVITCIKGSKPTSAASSGTDLSHEEFRVAFLVAMVLAAIGIIVTFTAVRIPRTKPDEECGRQASSTSTLVDPEMDQQAAAMATA